MTMTRPYKSAITPEAACRELQAEARRGWKHRESVDAFLELQRARAFDLGDPISFGTEFP